MARLAAFRGVLLDGGRPELKTAQTFAGHSSRRLLQPSVQIARPKHSHSGKNCIDVPGGLLKVVPNSHVPSGMQYHAFAFDRSETPELVRAFCRWLVRLCRKETLLEALVIA